MRYQPSIRRFTVRLLRRVLYLSLSANLVAFQTPLPPINFSATIASVAWNVRFGLASQGILAQLGQRASAEQEPQAARNERVRRLEVFPAETVAQPGQNVSLLAIPRGDDDSPIGGVPVSWRAEDVISLLDIPMGADGRFTSDFPGTFRVIAETPQLQASATVVIADADGFAPGSLGIEPPDIFDPAWRLMSPQAPTTVTNRRGRQPLTDEATSPPPGVPRKPHYEGPGQGNFRLDLPVLQLPGRGLGVSLKLTYNSRLWSLDSVNHKITYDVDADFPAPGWSLGFGKLLLTAPDKVVLIDGDGTRHGFALAASGDGFEGHSNDGSFIDCKVQFSGSQLRSGKVQYQNGTEVAYDAVGPGGIYPTSVTDANGNSLLIYYSENGPPKIRYIEDTLGRIITFYYDYPEGTPLLTAITAPGLGGGQRTLMRLHYGQVPLSYAFDAGLTASSRRTEVPWLIDSIFFPGTSNGYWFGDPDSFSSYGMLSKVVEQRDMHFDPGQFFDQMGTIRPGTMTHRQIYDYPPRPAPDLKDAPTYHTLTENWAYIDDSAVTQYVVHFDETPRSIYITYPNGTQEIQSLFNSPGEFNDGLIYEQENLDRNGRLIRLRSTSWEMGENGSPRIAGVGVMDERGQTTQTAYHYFRFDAPDDVFEYDYDRTTVLRRTHFIYETNPVYQNNHIFNLRKRVEVHDETDALVSRTDYSYDDFTVTATPGVVRHTTPANPYRGNLTKSISYTDAAGVHGPIPQTRHFDETGNVISQSTSCCELTSFEYTSGTQYAYPTGVTRGAADDIPASRVTTTATYDFNTGLQLSATDANGRRTDFGYAPENLRPETTTLSTNATASYSYDDADLSVIETRRTASGAIVLQTVARLNGRKLPRRQEVFDGSAWNLVDYQYNEMGRLSAQSRPYQNGEAAQWIQNLYDDSGRLEQTRLPEGSTVRQYFNEQQRPSSASSAPGPTVRSQDAWGREKWTRTDALGRLVEVVEPNPSGSGAVFAAGSLETSYLYNALDKLVEARQGAQRRAFGYDSLGRLTRQKLAERSATLNDAGAYVGAGGVWSDTFSYDERSNLIEHVDARGVKTIYDYRSDPLNRLQEVRYDSSGFGDTANPVERAPMVDYEYVQTGDVTRLLRVTASGVSIEEYGYDGEGRLNSKTVKPSGREGYPQVTEYLFDTVSRMTDVTYPTQYGFQSESRRHAHYNYDAASRLTALIVDGVSYASQFVYNSASQVTSMKIGTSGANQITEQYAFDAATSFLSNQKVTRSGASLMDLSYDYVRAGTTGGRTGQLTTLSNNLNHNRDKNYLYDALGRLAEVSGGAFSAPFWNIDYGYDRYGNRTSVAASGYTTGGAQEGFAGIGEPNGIAPSTGSTVSPYGNGAEFVSQSVPSFMVEGRLYDVSITMRNAGDTDWDPQLFKLGSQNPPNNTTWGSNRLLTFGWVYSGREAVFHGLVQPPNEDGTYNFQWQMLQENVEWFGDQTPNVPIHVVPPGPLPPTNLSLTVNSTTTIDLQWTVNSTDEDGFRVERKRLPAGEYEQIGLAGRGASTYSDHTCEQGTTYTYRVQAYNSVGPSPFSNEATATTSGPVPLDGHPSLSFDAQTNRITTPGFAYDAAGNQVRTLRADGNWQRYQYDEAGRLIRVKDDAGSTLELYTYSAGRQRLRTQYGETSNSRTYYVWNGDSVIAEYVETDALPTFPAWNKNYVYMGARLLGTQTRNGSQERLQYHHPDRLGTRLVTDPATGDYFEQTTLPFGVPFAAESTGSTNQRFTSYDRSSVTGLDNAVNRHYDALQGRFTQVDPLATAATQPEHPQTLNLYAYAANDPVNKSDPLGLELTMKVRVVADWWEGPDNPDDMPGHEGIHSHGWSLEIGWEWEPGAADAVGAPGGAPIEAGRASGGGEASKPPPDKVYKCHRPAEIPVLGRLASAVGWEHEWLKTSQAQAGMGNPNGRHSSDSPYISTAVVDHSGETGSCSLVTGVSEACVNSYLQVGRPTGRWSTWNNCNTFVAGVIDACGMSLLPETPPHDYSQDICTGD
ncbi:MAG TPA: RHS repeat-associated core domain-containing protein [Myxococcaceae bacterium]|nr:RHS repeat-associated core domain-containing protein [Myxococcaceae bacterium]